VSANHVEILNRKVLARDGFLSKVARTFRVRASPEKDLADFTPGCSAYLYTTPCYGIDEGYEAFMTGN
jgi:hypothetical protein